MLQNQPEHFDKNCRQPGTTWLAAYPNKDPHEQSEWWSQFKPALARHFSHRCGWLATSIGQLGVVEHYLACGPRKGVASPHRHLAFEWTNYRYAAEVINSRKGTLDEQILDPCQTDEGWFEIILPSFQLVATDQVPDDFKAKAQFTLEQLQLRRGFHSRWTRWDWYQRYWNNGAPDLNGLRRDAPLVAIAVEKAIAAGHDLPNPNDFEPTDVIIVRTRRYGVRSRTKQLEYPE